MCVSRRSGICGSGRSRLWARAAVLATWVASLAGGSLLTAAELPGKALYLANCAACHGEQGDGAGPAARFLYPKPRDFRLGRFKLLTTDNNIPSDEDLLGTITRGMPGSAMIPFGHLPEADRQQLVAYVRELSRQGIRERIKKQADASGDELEPEELAAIAKRLTTGGQKIALPKEMAQANAESIARGQVLYKTNCATCHGDTGKGDGAKEQKDDDGTPTRPRDFTRGIFKGGRDALQLYARIALGMPGTPMPASQTLQPAQIGDMVNYLQTMSDVAAQAKVEHKRLQLTAKKVGAIPTGESWSAVPATAVVVGPLWWREFADPDLKVQAAHDGQTMAVRLSWHDTTANETAQRTEDFEDMAAVQLFRGPQEPFLGMGAAAHTVDLWLWKAGWQKVTPYAVAEMDDYPYNSANYQGLVKDPKTAPDFLTARAAGNPNTNAERTASAANLAAKGFGSTTFRPKASAAVSAKSEYKNGRWTVVLQRPLTVGADAGLTLKSGDQVSAAFAIWDGAAKDRNGQKLISIWHDLKLE